MKFEKKNQKSIMYYIDAGFNMLNITTLAYCQRHARTLTSSNRLDQISMQNQTPNPFPSSLLTMLKDERLRLPSYPSDPIETSPLALGAPPVDGCIDIGAIIL